MRKMYFTLMVLLTAGVAKAQLTNFEVGDTAPDFTVTDLHGHEHQLSDYSGKWVIIDFFAYWCGPCQGVAPIVNDFYKKYGCNGYDVVVLGLEGDGTTAQTQNFEDNYGGDENYPTPTVSGLNGGADAVHTTYGPEAYPTIILIGPDGKFKNIDIWPVSSVTAFENAITSAGGGSALVPHNCNGALEIAEHVISDMAVYPNPATEKATVSFSASSAQTATIELYSISGQLLSAYQHTAVSGQNTFDLDLSGVDAGTYFVKVTTNNTASGMIPVVKQ